MADYTITKVADVPDVLGDYPGEMHFLAGPLGSRQVAVTYRRMPQHTGGKGAYGHYHKTQEEIVFVLSGKLQFKLGDDVVEVGPLTAVRIPPETPRSIWNEEPEDAEVLIVSTKIDARDDAVHVPDFWPE